MQCVGLLRRDIFLAEEETEEYKWDNRRLRVQIFMTYTLKYKPITDNQKFEHLPCLKKLLYKIG